MSDVDEHEPLLNVQLKKYTPGIIPEMEVFGLLIEAIVGVFGPLNKAHVPVDVDEESADMLVLSEHKSWSGPAEALSGIS